MLLSPSPFVLVYAFLPQESVLTFDCILGAVATHHESDSPVLAWGPSCLASLILQSQEKKGLLSMNKWRESWSVQSELGFRIVALHHHFVTVCTNQLSRGVCCFPGRIKPLVIICMSYWSNISNARHEGYDLWVSGCFCPCPQALLGEEIGDPSNHCMHVQNFYIYVCMIRGVGYSRYMQ